MNILISTLNSGRGSGVVVAQQCKELQRRGHRVTYVSTMVPSEPLPSGIKMYVVDIGTSPIPVHESLPTTIGETVVASGITNRQDIDTYIQAYIHAIRQAVQETNTDLILSHHANLNTVAAASVAKQNNIPLIVEPYGTCIRGYEENGAISRYHYGDRTANGYTWGLIRTALNKADGLIAISHFVAEELILPHLWESNKEKVRVMGSFIDPKPFTRVQIKTLARITQMNKLPLDRRGMIRKGILYVGPMTVRKGAYAIAGMGKYLNQCKNVNDMTPIYLMGRGKEGKMLEDRSKGVYFIESPTNDEVRAMMVFCGLLGITPNLSLRGEDFGMVHKELSLARIPVLAPASGAYTQDIIDGKTGFLIDPQKQTAKEFSHRVVEILEKGEKYMATVGLQARKNVLKNFNRKNTLDRFGDFIEASFLTPHSLPSVSAYRYA